MKIGDLVRYSDHFAPNKRRKIGIIVEFDKDNDPIVYWFGSDYKEDNYRCHIKVVSEAKHQ